MARKAQPERARLFAEAYLANGGRVSDAARAAGVTGSVKAVSVQANRLLMRARESGLIEQRLASIEGAMGAEETVRRLSTIARADIGRHLEFDEKGLVGLRVSQEHTGIIRELVEEDVRVEVAKSGETTTTTEKRVKRLKVADPIPALQTLAKYHGLVDGDERKPGETSVWLKVLLGLPPEQVRDLNARMLAATSGSNGNR